MINVRNKQWQKSNITWGTWYYRKKPTLMYDVTHLQCSDLVAGISEATLSDNGM